MPGRIGAAAVLCGAIAVLAGCAELPAWTGLRVPADRQNAGQIAYPSLLDIPPRPEPLTTAAQKEKTIQSLTADRARVAQDGEALRQEIDTGFAPPKPLPSGP